MYENYISVKLIFKRGRVGGVELFRSMNFENLGSIS